MRERTLGHSGPNGGARQRATPAFPGVLGFLAASLGCLAIMVATETRLAIVWDEGYSLGREERLRQWFQALRDPAGFAAKWVEPYEDMVPPNHLPAPRRDEMDTRGKLLRPPAVDWFWPFAREEPDGHPPVYALVGLAGDVLGPGWEPLARARLGPMIVFSVSCGAIFAFMRRRYGTWAAAAAAGAWLGQPHLFALAHYATYDGLLTSFWVVATLAFAGAVEPGPEGPRERPMWGWVLVTGVLLGLAMGTKFTGWFAPFPILAWVLLYRSRAGAQALAVAVVIGLVVMFALSPPWWHDPLLGIDRFLRSNLTRARTTPLKTLFLGRIYETPTGSLPWYNTIVWTLMVTPVGFLALGMVGIWRSIARVSEDPVPTLFCGHWAFLMMLRALPRTPGHDGIRQFLTAFGFLALLVGLGGRWMVGRFGCFGRALVVAAVVEGGVTVTSMIPVPLSYYNPAFGGLPGAVRLGMEPTYYWDALQPEILKWLNEHSSPGDKVRFSRYPTSWLYLRRAGKLKPGILPTDPGEYAWYVLQNRPGDFSPLDRDLVIHGAPSTAYFKSGVPLLWVFPYDRVRAWQREHLAPGGGDGPRSPMPAAPPYAPTPG